MSERKEVDKFAELLLQDSSLDPDSDLCRLSRQLLRRREVIERLEKNLGERCDGTLELVHANRDSILRIHEQGKYRIKQLLQKALLEPHLTGTIREDRARMVLKIIEAVNTFHPMHGETWAGFPEEPA